MYHGDIVTVEENRGAPQITTDKTHLRTWKSTPELKMEEGDCVSWFKWGHLWVIFPLLRFYFSLKGLKVITLVMFSHLGSFVLQCRPCVHFGLSFVYLNPFLFIVWFIVSFVLFSSGLVDLILDICVFNIFWTVIKCILFLCLTAQSLTTTFTTKSHKCKNSSSG